MSHELHYTSVPRGLKSGSVGFSTVAQTAGLPAPIADRLEGLSGYRPVYPPGSPSVGLNPAVVSHLKIAIGGHSFDVFSRIAFAGLDYSERGNNYAHHVAIEAHERPDAGPAWLASQARFLDAAWSGEPRVLPTGRAVPQGDRAPAICRAWADRFGDAGWAGVLAEAFLEDPKRPAYVVFEPGRDLLPLMVEALALIPPARRWDVTFSTYFTGQAQGLVCLWRGVLRDSPEHDQARRLPNSLILDPNTAATASGAALVDQARTGIAPAPAKKPNARPSPSIGTVTPPKSRPPRAPGRPQPIFDDLEIDVEPEPPRRSSPAPSTRKPLPAAPAPPAPRRKRATPEERRSQMFMRAWIGFAGLLVVGLVGSMGWMVLGPKHVLTIAEDVPPPAIRDDLAQGTVPQQPAFDQAAADEAAAAKVVADKIAADKAATPIKVAAAVKPHDEPPKVVHDVKPPEPPKPSPTATVHHAFLLQSWGPLPEPVDGGGAKPLRWSAPPGRTIKAIGLIGWDKVPKLLEVKENPSDPTQAPITVGFHPNSAPSAVELGKFTLTNDSVTFELSKNPHPDWPTALASLRRCLLQVEFRDGDPIGLLFDNPPASGPIMLKGVYGSLKKGGSLTEVFPKGKPPSRPIIASCEVRHIGGGAAKEIPIQIVDNGRKAIGTYKIKDKEEVAFSLFINDDGKVQFAFAPSPEELWRAGDLPRKVEGVILNIKKLEKTARETDVDLRRVKAAMDLAIFNHVEIAPQDAKYQQDLMAKPAEIADAIKRSHSILAAFEFRDKYEFACVFTIELEGRTLRIPLN